MNYEPEAKQDKREWVQIAIMMVEDGYSIAQAARMLEMTYDVVYRALRPQRRSEINRRSKRRHGAPPCSVCGRPLCYNSPQPQPVCKPCEKAHARRNDEQIIALWQRGFTSPEIAERLGDMTPLQVNHRVSNIRLDHGIELERRK